MMAHDPILNAFARVVAFRPDATLLWSPEAAVRASELDAFARRIEARLASSDIGDAALIALQAPNGPIFAAALLALRRCDRAVALLDERTPGDERRRALAAFGAGAVVRGGRGWDLDPAEVVIEPTGHPAVPLPAGTAFVKLTSGSTGSPRGIAVSADALVADDAGLARTMGLVADERILAAVPVSHSYGLSSVLLPTLVRGSMMVVPSDDRPFAAIDAARAADVTFLPTVPAYLEALMRMTDPPPLPPSLRLAVTAGAPLKPETAAIFRARYGRSVHVFYGASEVGGICFDREGGAGERGTLGTPVDGVTVELEPVEGVADDAGLVVVRSPAAALGYLPEPDRTLADGCFRTADLATLRDGELALVGRVDDVINVKGKKVDPREVERVLLAFDGVRDAVVVGRTRSSEAHPAVFAVVAVAGTAVGADGILTWCRGRLAPHKVPRGVVVVSDIPRTARGKLDRNAIDRLLEAASSASTRGSDGD